MDNAQKAKKIEGATLSGDYSIYYAKLTDTWNSASDLKSIATKANDQFKSVISYDANTKKADVGICVDKAGGAWKSYIFTQREASLTKTFLL